MAYPNRITDLRLTFQPNVALREGSIIRIKLPGFRTPYKQVALRPLQSNLYDLQTRYAVLNGKYQEALRMLRTH